MGIYDRVLITGGGGMLAKALIRALRARAVTPTAPTRDQLDVTDAESIFELTRQLRPTLILNCAAYTKVDAAEENEPAAHAVNGNAPAYLNRAASFDLIPFVHFSTDFVFNGNASRPYRIDDPTQALSAYGRTKLAGERSIIGNDYPTPYLIIRTAWLYGPGGACFPQTMITAAKAGKPLRVVNDQVGSPTFTHDLADATLNLLDANAASGIYHVTNSGQTSWFDFTRAILEEFNLTADLAPTTSAEWKRLRPNSTTRPAYSVLDTSKYTQATGKTMRPWREALKAYRAALEGT